MVRLFTSLIVTVVIMTMVVIAWTPVAKSGGGPQFQDCLDFCEDQAICQCAKLLGGSVRLTLCNIGADCDFSGCGDSGPCGCVCEVDPLCKPWEKDIVVQSFPIEIPEAQNCD